MDSGPANQEVPDTTQVQPSQSGRWRWLPTIPAALVVIAALAQIIGMPFVSEKFGVMYGVLASVTVIILLLFSLKVTPADGASGGHFVYLLSLIIPAVVKISFHYNRQ
jgi:hypothetical protein